MSKTNSKIFYQLTDQVVGQGATSTVYKAFNTAAPDDATYACKVISKKSLSLEELANVRKEISILKHFNINSSTKSSNIVTAHSIAEDANNIYLFMDLVQGEDMCTFIDNYYNEHQCGLPEKEAFNYFSQMVESVKQCHQHGVTHRDVKLENFLLDKKQNTIKLADFGLSDFLHTQSGQKVEKLHTKYCGSAAYACPELISRKPYKGKPVDVWALGIVLFCLLQGWFPFGTVASPTGQERVNSMFEQIINAPVEFQQPISKEARQLILSMLAKDPNDRPTIEQIEQSSFFNKYKNPPPPPQAAASSWVMIDDYYPPSPQKISNTVKSLIFSSHC